MATLSKIYFIALVEGGSTPGNPVGLRLTNPSTTTIGVAAGQAPDFATGVLINVPTALVINMATNGLLGLDTGAIALLQSYFVYVIKNPTTGAVSAMASLSSTFAGTTKPAGYTLGRRIGSFRTLAAAATILPFVQEGSGADRRYHFSTADASRALTAPDASAGSIELPLAATAAQAAGSAAAVPSTATSARVDISVLTTAGTAGATAVQFGLNGAGTLGSGTIGITAADIAAAVTKIVQMDLPLVALTVATTQGVTIRTNDAQTLPSLIVNGYTESL